MNFKILVILVLLVSSIFFHYYNKHKIIELSREKNLIQEKYNSEKDVNLNLVIANNNLNSRTRIQKLAAEKLGMYFPKDKKNIHTIEFNRKKNTFCLVDFIVPSAEALTK